MKNVDFFRGIAEKNEFITFGNIHIGLLLIALIGCFLILNSKESKVLELIIGIGLLSQQFILYYWYLTTKYCLFSEGLPLYHCRIAIIALGIGFLFNKKKLLKIGSYWGIFGSISALLFVGLDPFYFPHITQFSYFIGHFLLLWSSVYCLFIKKIGMNNKDYYTCLIVTNIYHLSMFVINPMLKSNYGYMTFSPISIGQELAPVIYGLIVIIIFNAILTMEYMLCNRNVENITNEDLVISN